MFKDTVKDIHYIVSSLHSELKIPAADRSVSHSNIKQNCSV